MIIKGETPQIREKVEKIAKEERDICLQYKETLDLLGLFFEQGIRVMPLKGPVLSKRLYGTIAARGLSVDIDLLVEQKNKILAGKLLEEKGYNFMPDPIVETERLWQYIYKKSDGTAVDLHWEISPTSFYKERMKVFWEGTRLREEEGIRYYEFKEEELLTYLSVHFVDSTYLTGLRHLTDIDKLLAKYKDTLNWANVVEKAKKWQLSASLYTTLDLSKRLLGSHVPEDVLKKLKPGIIKCIFIAIFANKRVILHRDSRRKRFIENFLKYLLFQILETKSLKDYFTIFFPPKEKMGNKGYSQRLARGIVRFIRSLKDASDVR